MAPQNRHKVVPKNKKKPLREQQADFFKAQKEREEKELAGTNARPNTQGNPAMGIPFNSNGKRGGSKGKPRTITEAPKKDDSEEDLLTGEGLVSEDPDAEKRETF